MSEKKNILVVDDELGPRESLRMILKDSYDVVTAPDGRKALDILSRREFDVVILDIRMAEMGGLEVLREIKSRSPETEVVMITAYASIDTAKDALRYGALDYLIKPFDHRDVRGVVERGLKAREGRAGDKLEMAKLRIADSSLNQEVAAARRTIGQQYAATVKSLLSAIDGRDGYTQGHSERVSRFSAFLAEKAGFPPEKILTLEQAALIHDIGNVGVDAALLSKPGRLTPEEFSEVRKHPAIGAQIVASVDFLQEMLPVILHHHERFDGTGFPDGLKGEGIPMAARVVSVAGAVDAMLTDRPFRRALSLEAVREEMVRSAGRQFDPEIVRIALSGGVLECYMGIFS